MADARGTPAPQSTARHAGSTPARDAQPDEFAPDCADGSCKACRLCYQEYVAGFLAEAGDQADAHMHGEMKIDESRLGELDDDPDPSTTADTPTVIDEVLERRLDENLENVQALLYRQQYFSLAAADLDLPGVPLLCWACVGAGDDAEWGLWLHEFDPAVHKCQLSWWQVNLDRGEDLDQFGKLTAIKDCTLKVRQAAAMVLGELLRRIRNSEPPDVRALRMAVEAVAAAEKQLGD